MRPAPSSASLGRVAFLLRSHYGRPRRKSVDPLDCLVETVLSQNTSDTNSLRAFAALKAAYPSWRRASRAPVRALERTIRSGGLARIKSRRIKKLLAEVEARMGRLDLSDLQRLTGSEAEGWLRSLPGVGPKTSACVVLFGLGRPAFPVDTHVHRIARRLGFVAARDSAERAHRLLAPAVPAGHHLDLHLNLIRLGREQCRPRAPRCTGCPLRSECAYAARAA